MEKQAEAQKHYHPVTKPKPLKPHVSADIVIDQDILVIPNLPQEKPHHSPAKERSFRIKVE